MMAFGIGKSDVGRERQTNEDAFLVDNELGLFAVADGMGGLAHGDVAARVALSTLRSVVSEHIGGGWHFGPDDLCDLLSSAVRMASRSVYRLSQARLGRPHMGCTLTCVLVRDHRAIMAHVGDSRLYLLRDGFAFQMTTDHTLAQQLADRGVIDQAAVRGHRFEHMLSRAVGIEFEVEPQTRVIEMHPEEALLLCTDGLSGYIPGPGWLAECLAGEEVGAVPDSLIAHANEAGGHDNITALVVRLERRQFQRRGAVAPRPAARPARGLRIA